jgi:hypothetical protein
MIVIGSMLQINGREIFQKERADKEPSGEPATDLARAYRTLDVFGWNRESYYDET